MLRNKRTCVVVAALLAITSALLAGCGVAQTGATQPAATPTPTLDPATQPYLNVLRTYYVPIADATGQVLQCLGPVNNAPAAQLAQMLQGCRPLFAAQLTAVLTARTQLAAAPPARWQAQHTALKQAVQAFVDLITEQLAAIDAHDVARFKNAIPLAVQAASMFCAPIQQLNAGPPPLSPSLPVPDVHAC